MEKTMNIQPFPMESESCCCSVADHASDSFERPGYALCSFVENFENTAVGMIPRIKTRLERSDHIGTILTRADIGRSRYRIAAGLYCVGKPDSQSPVLVTANYKLTFDMFRKELQEISAWILVLDTRGINVWCAAGKGTFSSEEVCRQVKSSGIATLVSHRELILPQLSATGVSAMKVKKDCGFKVVWGPVYAKDIRRFLDAGMTAAPSMRQVTFSLAERLVLIPVEIVLLRKYLGWLVPAIFILSGISPNIFSISMAWSKGLTALVALLAGVLAGAVITPALLPWIPGLAFSIKGALTGLFFGLWIMIESWRNVGGLGALALLVFTIAVSSYLAMNFTGSTPFTSPSGVEKEMRKAMPFQAGGVIFALILWIMSGVIR